MDVPAGDGPPDGLRCPDGRELALPLLNDRSDRSIHPGAGGEQRLFLSGTMAGPGMDLSAFTGKLLEEQDGGVLREAVPLLA